MTVQDLLGLGKPVEKLLDVVSKGVGAFYEPWGTTRNAKANAKAINILAEACRSNPDIPIKFEQGNASIESVFLGTVEDRAIARMLHLETKKQENIEAIVRTAGESLSQEESVTDEPLSNDWITRFFNISQDISEEGMQIIWARILAGEVKQPNTYSLRTLEALKCLSSMEANKFKEIAKYVIAGRVIPIVDDERFPLDSSVIALLDEAGLLSRFTASFGASSSVMVLNYGNYNLKIINLNKANVVSGRLNHPKVAFGCFNLTKVGSELLRLIKPEIDENFLICFGNKLKQKGYGVSYEEVRKYEDKYVTIKSVDL